MHYNVLVNYHQEASLVGCTVVYCVHSRVPNEGHLISVYRLNVIAIGGFPVY